jgi:RNA polymerase-interacting CarD/CdnL/TRCF family regulator
MSFHEGEAVMHWTHGLGKVLRLEPMILAGEKLLYYVVQIGDMTLWVPDDEKLETRLRLPTPPAEFKGLMDILSHPGERLPIDRFERKKLLLAWLEDGRAETLFRVIRSLFIYHRDGHPLNEDDRAFLKRSKKALLAEWSFIMSIPLARADHELQHLLASAQETDVTLRQLDRAPWQHSKIKKVEGDGDGNCENKGTSKGMSPCPITPRSLLEMPESRIFLRLSKSRLRLSPATEPLGNPKRFRAD